MNNEGDWINLATRLVDIVGIVIIFVGSFGALIAFLIEMVKKAAEHHVLVSDFRSGLGQSILLGLEFLVAADIINTVAVEPTV